MPSVNIMAVTALIYTFHTPFADLIQRVLFLEKEMATQSSILAQRILWIENPMDGEAWWATVQGSQRVGHDFTFTFIFRIPLARIYRRDWAAM